MKNTNFSNHYLALVILFLVGCKPSVEELINREILLFKTSEFILKDYRTSRTKHHLKKVIWINGLKDSILIRDTMLPVETEVLSHLDIDDPKLAGKYTADTAYGVYGDAEHITYITNDKDLNIQKIEIFLENGSVKTVKAIQHRNSLINQFNQELTYYAGVGYELNSFQQQWTGDSIRTLVKAFFVD